MSRRLLIIEPDAAGRAMMDRVLAADGYSAETAGTVLEARALLDAGRVEVVVIDELAGSKVALEQVRWLREKYPTVPVVVTGALLSRRVMQQLVRLRVSDALAKPFTPIELREAVARAIDQKAAHHEEALEYDVALTDARRAIAAGLLSHARAPLARAQAMSPFDSEIMALHALLAELEGKDDDADRGYRAALALRDEEACPAPDPHEGLARLAAYRGARPVDTLEPGRAVQPLWMVSDPAVELRDGGGVGGAAPHVVVMGLGLTAEGPGTVFFRDGGGPRGFAILAAALRAESIVSAFGVLGRGPIRAPASTAARLDLARIEAVRGGPPAPASRETAPS